MNPGGVLFKQKHVIIVLMTLSGTISHHMVLISTSVSENHGVVTKHDSGDSSKGHVISMGLEHHVMF